LNQGGKDYGQAGKIENFLKDQAKNALYATFNQTDFSISEGGLSTESLKALEIFASLQKAEPNTFKALITTFIQKINKQGVLSLDIYSFYTRPSDFNMVTLNYFVVKILQASEGAWETLGKEQKIGLRNYFVQHASLSSDINTLLTALKAL